MTTKDLVVWAITPRYRVFVWTGWRIQGWRSFEYWDRLCLGFVYVLRYRDES